MKKLAIVLIILLLAGTFAYYSFTGFVINPPAGQQDDTGDAGADYPDDDIAADEAPNPVFNPFVTTAMVTRIIDGDTVVINGKERVRLLGIDTPERGQFYYKEATQKLKDIIEFKTVSLESSVDDRDKYGRLLRYIYINKTLANLEMVRRGYASAYIFDEDVHTPAIRLAEQQARIENLGIWKLTQPDIFCLGIFEFHYNAKGNDNENLNEEYVTFRNKCEKPLSITGWKVQDFRNNTYTFQELSVQNKTTVTLHTGRGTDNATDTFWGSSNAIWNNEGDRLVMFDRGGNQMLDYEY